ncbi:hypothetical protein AVEN_33877-1 [Araneus ventricosus]|uniref:Uncharacterized protein n=1 Tax=Araneus ventricosus TaxID=182803 RepID=A0A4Y2JV45_ARAVE|nr:hypothetical protein AVEN_33877-1 [Araneus ventricosus]
MEQIYFFNSKPRRIAESFEICPNKTSCTERPTAHRVCGPSLGPTIGDGPINPAAPSLLCLPGEATNSVLSRATSHPRTRGAPPLSRVLTDIKSRIIK